MPMIKEASGRKYWMDAFRGIAVLLVIVQHSVTVPAYEGYPSSEFIGQLNDVLAPYRIPLLLTLSGMFLHRSLAKGLFLYAEGKIRRIAWPMVVWGPITVLLSSMSATVIGALLGPRHLWFLVTLLFCYVIGVLVLKINAMWLCIALIALYTIPTTGESSFAYLFWFGAYFMFGAWLGPRLEAWQGSPGWLAGVLGVVAVVWAVAVIAGVELIAPLEFVISLSGLGALLWLGARLPRAPWAEWVGQRSIVFYVAHVPAMLLVFFVLESDTTMPPLLISLIMMIVGVLGPLMLTPRWFAWLFAFPRIRIPSRFTEKQLAAK